MHLDELPAELRVRLETVLNTRDRVRALLNAVVSVGSDLDLETVLRRIVETAATLVDATYGALGVIGEASTLVQFVPVGLSEEEIARIEHWPHGLGLLGLLIKQPRSLRLARIADHPESFGFPPGHPPMGSFLGVPVRVREEVFGNLYLTEKRGGGEFDEDDEAIVAALAAAAGVAIENAWLYEETRRREMWLRASSEVTTSLLSGAAPQEVLTVIARRAREMAGADAVAVLLPEETGQADRAEPGETGRAPEPEAERAQPEIGRVPPVWAGRVLRVVLVDGAAEEGLAPEPGRTVTQESPAGRAFAGGEPVTVADPGGGWLPARAAGQTSRGPAAAVPMGASGAVRGVLWLGKRSGRIPFNRAEVSMLQSFAGQAAVALELAESRMDAERLGLLEERDRIAKDLHDVVIQRLFAVAMTLMSTVPLVERPEAVARVQSAIGELDGTIRQIRSTIFALQTPAQRGETGLRVQLVALVEEARGHLGFMPGLSMEGRLDSAVPQRVADHVPAVLREALSNVVRHARASKVEVLARAHEGRLTLVVQDDGVGLPEGGRRSGLRNLQDRAERLGGSFTAEAPARGGTRLTWSVPLEQRGTSSP
ncbi:two-component system sensor histidine kinase [Streptosporangium fragile]|uniref:Two-component system sensor histidine kinase n=2 Tax=Streptosporangium fragile TaxID=46186 RepID=A0ABN3W669_9ACTN